MVQFSLSFYRSLAELNEAIRGLLTRLNEHRFQKLPGNRREMFETLDRPALLPLPTTPYTFEEWSYARVGIDYTLELRPVHHRKEDRIRSHVLLCWLALHLVRVAERETGETWDTIRAKMERMHLGVFFGKDGKVLQRTELTQDQQNLLKMLKMPPPPLFRKIATTPENL